METKELAKSVRKVADNSTCLHLDSSLEICGLQEDQHGFWWSAGKHSICLYADDGWISGRSPIWMWAALTTMVKCLRGSDCRLT